MKPDYTYGCPVCGVHHRPGTLVGLTFMNRKCANRYNKMTMEEQAEVRKRAEGVKP